MVVVCLVSCKSPPTQVTIVTDSNVGSDRAAQLFVYALSGSLTPAQLAARVSTTMPSVVLARNERGDGNLRWPGSFSIIPPANNQTQSVTVLLRVKIVGNEFSPDADFDRVLRFSFARGQPLLSRVYLNAACSDRAEGCDQVSAQECTVDQLCAEIGATCGDDGECVDIEQPTVETNADGNAPQDVAAATRVDVVVHRLDASRAQDGGDASNVDSGATPADSSSDTE